MAEFPALPLFTDAYLADTRHLTAAQHGAYLMLLMTAWRTKDCSIPNDDRLLSRYSCMDLRTWKANKDVVLEFWIKSDDQQKFFQLRLLDERKYVEDKRNKNAAAGKSSALKRKERHSTSVPTKTQPESNQPTPTPKIDTNVSIPPTPKGGVHVPSSFLMPDGTFLSFEQLFDRYWLNYPAIRDKGHKGSAKEQLLKKLKEGVNYEVIGRGITKYRKYCDNTGEKQPDMFRWIRDEGWDRDYELPSSAPSAAGRSAGNSLEAAASQALADQTRRPEGRAERLKNLGLDDDSDDV